MKSPYLFEDETGRFSRRVATYVRYRPGYPREMVDMLGREAGLKSDSTIADIGSGTGLLSRAFLDAGYAVTGVEPNREMREAGNRELAGYARFRVVDGRADETTLPTGSCDLVMAGQAFHWFDSVPTRAEWVRILKPGGVAALIWNERFTESDFMREAEEVVNKYGTAPDADGILREGGRGRIATFFAPAEVRRDEFPNHQVFGVEGLVGRVASCSYTPSEGDPGYEEMAAELEQVFQRHQRDGKVDYQYRTKVFWGRLTR